MDAHIATLDPTDAETSLADLVTLLIDAVNDGASVGFLAPVRHDAALDYWRSILADVERRTVEVLVARVGGTVVGAVQLALATQPNAAHRAEVRRLLVARSVRRRGIGRALMVAVEETARGLGRTLLVLNTRRGDPPSGSIAASGTRRWGRYPTTRTIRTGR